MTATFFLAGQEMQQPDVRENADGTVSIGLNAGFWVTVTGRPDCAVLMKAAADADSLFIGQHAAAEARQVIAGQLAPAGDMAALAHEARPLPAGHVAYPECQMPCDEDCEIAPVHCWNQHRPRHKPDWHDGGECNARHEARPLVPLPERDPDGMPLGWAALHEELGDAEHAAGLAPNPVPALLLDPDCRDGKHGSCAGGPCMCGCHEPAYAEPLPDLPYERGGMVVLDDGRDIVLAPPLPDLPQRDPGHALDALHAGAAADRMARELSPEALAGETPLETLAADPEDTP